MTPPLTLRQVQANQELARRKGDFAEFSAIEIVLRHQRDLLAEEAGDGE